MTAPNAFPARLVALIGFAVIAAYAVLGALQIIVLNPMAAVPGRSLPEIHAAVADAGESLSPVAPIVFAVVGMVLGGGVLAYAWAAPIRTPPAVIAAVDLVILVLGAPAHFIAGFSSNLALADAFRISGTDHSGWSSLLLAASGAALVALAVLVVVLAARTRTRRVFTPPAAAAG
ncbi:hypothetical protein [Agromyces arachidis]|uniref:hypothetical protein n=1 Tax=Agromyces arachidis TaxID=766966 RepID=UPI004057BF8E